LKIEILGSGCEKCKKLELSVEQALKDLGTYAEITQVKDIQEIMNRSVMMTPALLINGEAKSEGRVPSVDEIKELIKESIEEADMDEE
jgi:small redox-active disulfide protein 2